MTLTPSLILDEIMDVVRGAIDDGLIKSIGTEAFNDAVGQLTGSDLEDFLQHLWDNL